MPAPKMLLIATLCMLSACKIIQITPDSGGIVSRTGNHDCAASSTCEIDVENGSEFSDTFTAAPAAGYVFTHWKQADRYLCGGVTVPCALEGVPGLFTDQDIDLYLEPVFAVDPELTATPVNRYEEIEYFRTLDATLEHGLYYRSRIQEPRRISGNGRYIVFTLDLFGTDLSLSGRLSESGINEERAAKVYLYDTETETGMELYSGEFATNNDGWVTSLEYNFWVDISDDGEKVVLLYNRTTTGFAGGDPVSINTTSNVAVIDTGTGSVTDIAEMPTSGAPAKSPIKISADGNQAVFTSTSLGESSTTWGVQSYNDGPMELYALTLSAGADPVMLSAGTGDPEDEIENTPGSFDISDDGAHIVFQYAGDSRVITVSSSGSLNELYQPPQVQAPHVGISGDGQTVIYSDWGDNSVDYRDGDRIYREDFGGGNRTQIWHIDDDSEFSNAPNPSEFIVNEDASEIVMSGNLYGYDRGPGAVYWFRVADPETSFTRLVGGDLLNSASSDFRTMVLSYDGDAWLTSYSWIEFEGTATENDRDGDGVIDEDDAFPDDPDESSDSDGDGVGDNEDVFPDDPDRSEAECEDLDLRLEDGDSGLLEICYDGRWGTVCDDSFDTLDASVAARQLGFSSCTIGDASGDGTIWLDDLNCSGDEEQLGNCASNGWGVHNCSHSEDVALTCISDSTGGGTSGSESEPNDSFATADSISGDIPGSVSDSDLNDYFLWTADQSADYLFRLFGEDTDLDLRVYDASQNFLDSSANGGSTEAIRLSLSAGSAYYIEVYNYDATDSEYQVFIDNVSSNDSESEPNDSINSASELTGRVGGSLSSSDLEDFFRFSVSATADVSVLLATFGTDADLFLYNSSGELIDSSETLAGDERVDLRAIAGVNYYVRVLNYDGSDADYYLEVIENIFAD